MSLFVIPHKVSLRLKKIRRNFLCVCVCVCGWVGGLGLGGGGRGKASDCKEVWGRRRE